MATIAEWSKIDDANVAQSFAEAQQKLSGSGGEQVLDMSAVRRIDTNGMAALGKLVAAAEEKKVKLVLRGVNIDIYRVLKLTRVAERLSFIS